MALVTNVKGNCPADVEDFSNTFNSPCKDLCGSFTFLRFVLFGIFGPTHNVILSLFEIHEEFLAHKNIFQQINQPNIDLFGSSSFLHLVLCEIFGPHTFLN